MKTLFATFLMLGSSVFASEPVAPVAEATKELAVGSDAPAVKFSKFFKGTAVDKLDPNQTYLIECWAPWCVPCIAGFPHLTEIAKATEGKVTVIGVSVWDKKTTLEGFQALVDKKGDKIGFNITSEVDGSISKHWLEAAGRKSIPCAFIVVKGKIVWIGPPAVLTGELLNGIADGTKTAADIPAPSGPPDNCPKPKNLDKTPPPVDDKK